MKNRNGFTLIELLIVIVVIAVLAAMMMLSSNETVSSAQAAKIINDMTQLKKATVAWYVEHHDQIKQGLTGDNNVKEEFGINNNGKIMRFSGYMKSKGSEA